MLNVGVTFNIGFRSIFGAAIPLAENLLRFLHPREGSLIYDIVGDYDAEETSLDIYDMNPANSSNTDFALISMDKSNTTIWGGVDKNGNTIRDLPGYNASNPYEWLDAELDVDIINTYVSDDYTARIFANFEGSITDLTIYDRQLDCYESKLVHRVLNTGGWWILNRGAWNDCGVWKDEAIWRD